MNPVDEDRAISWAVKRDAGDEVFLCDGIYLKCVPRVPKNDVLLVRRKARATAVENQISLDWAREDSCAYILAVEVSSIFSQATSNALRVSHDLDIPSKDALELRTAGRTIRRPTQSQSTGTLRQLQNEDRSGGFGARRFVRGVLEGRR